MIIDTFVLSNPNLNIHQESMETSYWCSTMVDLDFVYMVKLASPDPDAMGFNKTMLYAKDGDVYTIDEMYEEFAPIFKQYKEEQKTLLCQKPTNPS